MTAVGKSQVCDECRRLKIQCLLVPAGGQRGPKQKVESDAEEPAQPKRLKPVIEVSGMRPELTTQEVLLEHSELLGDVWGLLKSQLEVLKSLQQAVVAMGSAMDDIVKQMSWMEQRSMNGNEGAWSI